jgi:spermidine/putrescine transport system permease protein
MSTVEREQPLALPAQVAPALEGRRRDRVLIGTLTAPLAFWLLGLVVAPGVIFLLYSFWYLDAFQIVRDFTLQNYRAVFTESLYRRALAGSLLVGGLTATLCTALAFALAWAVRFHVRRGRDILVLVIVISSVGSYLARLYSWRSILGSQGLIN